MWDDYVERGKTVEQQFASILSGAVFATKEQDMHEHWDVMDEMAVKYDVKGMKNYRRSDDKPTDRLHWIELRNVNGKNGWLYGEADVIAFETRKWWLLVDREDLAVADLHRHAGSLCRARAIEQRHVADEQRTRVGAHARREWRDNQRRQSRRGKDSRRPEHGAVVPD